MMSDGEAQEQQVEPLSDVSNTEAVSNNQLGTNGDTASQSTWKYADGVLGQGEVPEWFIASKYKTVEEQAKAANELRKKLGAHAEDAPEHYELDYEKYKIQKDDPTLNELNGLFKELNLSQGAYEKIIDKYTQLQQKQHETFEANRQQAFNAFGPETKEIKGRLDTWINNNFSAEEKEIINSWQMSPEDIRVLEKIRSGAPKSAPPTVNQAPSTNQYESSKSIQATIEQNWQRMKEDPNYRATMEHKRREAMARERQG